MQKIAQKRSILNKLREMTNISGQAAEKFFNPEFQRVMESLREKDNDIRSIAAGKEIDGGNPGADPIGLKELFKSAKSNFNRREYMTAVADLGRFHKKVFDLVQIIDNLRLDVDQVHHEFLFKDLGDEHKQQLHELKSRFATHKSQALLKEAGIMDFLYNITSKRGRALALWEKRYPQQIKKLKSDTSNLINKSESLLSLILSSLKDMASARATRDVDRYVKSADKISKAFLNYDKTFKDYYSVNIKGFLDKIELIAPVTKVDSKPLGQQEITNVEPQSNLPIPLNNKLPNQPFNIELDKPSDPYAPTILAPMPSSPISPQNVTPPPVSDTIPVSQPPTHQEEGAEEEKSNENEEEFASDRLAKEYWGKKSHNKFFNTLNTLSSENPVLLKNIINKYAKSILKTDLELAVKLLKLSDSIE